MKAPSNLDLMIGPKILLGICGWTLSVLCLSGCLLNSKKSVRGKGASDWFVKESIYLDRIGDGTTFRLQFKTTVNVICELAYYSQEPNLAPTKENPTIVPCSSPDKPRKDFTERIENLATNTLYFIQIGIWDANIGKKTAKYLTVKENSGPSDNGDGNNQDGTIESVYVARVNLPLSVAEIHKHALVKPLSLTEIKKNLARSEGCQSPIPEIKLPFRDANAPLDITNLASRDLANGAATLHPESSQRLSMQFSSLNIGMDKWSLMYQLKGRDVLSTFRPIASFASLIMTSSQSYNIESKQPAEASEGIRVDTTLPLKFSWTSSSQLLPTSYVTVQIGSPQTQKSIYCTFAADKNSGIIEQPMLLNLPNEKTTISVELVSNLFVAKENWLVSSNDWRATRIEK
jgi:hypothetical protein